MTLRDPSRLRCAPRSLVLIAWLFAAVTGCAGRDARSRVVARAPITPIAPPSSSVDADRDGLIGANDRCPNAPEDRDGVADDDGCPEVDQDCDRVADTVDRCPTQPEDIDQHEDSDGCPDRDNDGDSIADGCDECPDQAEIVNGLDDEDGCPDTGPLVLLDMQGLELVVRFERGATAVRRDDVPLIAMIPARIGRNLRVLSVRLIGHASSDERRAQYLSDARAMDVRRRLVAHGIEPRLIGVRGDAASRPVNQPSSAPDLARDRRVEITIFLGPAPVSPPPSRDAQTIPVDAAALATRCPFDPVYEPVAGGCPLDVSRDR